MQIETKQTRTYPVEITATIGESAVVFHGPEASNLADEYVAFKNATAGDAGAGSA